MLWGQEKAEQGWLPPQRPAQRGAEEGQHHLLQAATERLSALLSTAAASSCPSPTSLARLQGREDARYIPMATAPQ